MTIFEILQLACYIVITLGLVLMLGLEMRRCLMMLQQNSYRTERYRRWLRSSGDTTSFLHLGAMAVFFASLAMFTKPVVAWILLAIMAFVGVKKLLTAKYKKPLVMTKRARRIFMTATVTAMLVTAGCFFIFRNNDTSYSDGLFIVSLAILVLYIITNFLIPASNVILTPVERHIDRKFINDARHRLESMPDIKIIGITGSYGKTSTKHYLYRILSEKYDTLMTPGSYNTTMGVVRTIREYMKPYNEVFIVEMGAKQPGDIKEICDLVHPAVGIVTAVGPQHLESFKSIENVQKTKFELVDALPSDGLAIINNDFDQIATRRVDNVPAKRYAVNIEADYRIDDINYGADGTNFTLVTPDGSRLEFFTHLVGECNVSNLAAAIICADYLEVPLEKIRYAVEHIEQVEHRLQMRKTGTYTIIDDAYNSNPVGAGMALDVLAAMNHGRRIVVTPGMIELGDEQATRNRDFGKKIAESADIAIIVNRYNREAIVEGARDGGMDDTAIRTVDSFAEAQRLLASMGLTKGDTVLLENDLPDTFK